MKGCAMRALFYEQGICRMSKYEYRVDAPADGYARGVKYRNPHYFDGNPEKDANQVAVIPGFDSIVEAYASIGITALVINEEYRTTADDNSESQSAPVVQHEQVEQADTPVGEMTDEQLSALYEGKFGRKPGNMKRDTILAALEDE